MSRGVISIKVGQLVRTLVVSIELDQKSRQGEAMPANLPPQYFEAEKSFRLAKTIPEKIAALENMLSIMPKHKGTDRLRAELRTKIARLSEEAQQRHISGRGALHYIRKEGAGQAALVGLPNTGKSQLLASLTEASPRIGDYPFTTQSPLPGMMKFENIQIQIVDLPALTDRNARSWLSGILRNADLLLLVVDLSSDPLEQMRVIREELPKMRIKPVGQESQEVEDEFVFPKKVLVIANKNDLDNNASNYRRLEFQYKEFPLVSVSAREKAGLDRLKREIFLALDILRVYTKTPGQEPDLTDPVILPAGSTVEDVAESIHKYFRGKMKYAQVWGSGKFEGQKVSRQYALQDGDIVELHL